MQPLDGVNVLGPRMDAREMIARVDYATAGPLRPLGVPVKLADTPGAVRTPPPSPCRHTHGVPAHVFGLDAGAIAGLRRQNEM